MVSFVDYTLRVDTIFSDSNIFQLFIQCLKFVLLVEIPIENFEVAKIIGLQKNAVCIMVRLRRTHLRFEFLICSHFCQRLLLATAPAQTGPAKVRISASATTVTLSTVLTAESAILILKVEKAFNFSEASKET